MRFRFIAPLLALALIPAAAQQREPAFEVYALTGGYFHGNLSAAHEWRPQGGAGILAPLGSRWGALFDATTSTVERWWLPDGGPGAAPNDNQVWERRVVLTPSVVRLWRRNRFSIYAGGGPGWEHKRQRSRYRLIVARGEHGEPILADRFEERASNRTDGALLLRAGAILSVSRRVVLRTDFAVLPRYVDEKASKSLSVGVGYRF
jgi:hypothetical protein